MKIALLFLVLITIPSILSLHGQEAVKHSGLIRVELPGELDYRYAGFIAALEQGFFKEAGFEVELSFGKSQEDIQKLVLEGEVQFSVCGSEIILDHYNGKAVIATAAFFQRSPTVLVLKHEPGETIRLKEKTGYKIVFESKAPLEITSILNNQDQTVDDFDIDYDSKDKISRFQKGEIDGFEANYLTDNYFLKSIDRKYHVYNPEHFGTELYDQVLYTGKAFYSKFKQRVDKFNGAIAKGWKYTLDNKNEMVQNIFEKDGFTGSRGMLFHQHWTVENLMILPNLVSIGRMKSSRWENISELYINHGLLPEGYKVGGFYHRKNLMKKGLLSTYYIEISIGLTFILLSLVAMILFNRRLLNMVNSRTSELAEVNWQLNKLNEDLESSIHQRTQELEQALKEAKVASRAKSSFLANMTHEIRTPMNSILGFAQIMKEKSLDKDMLKYLDTINSSGQNLLRIINDVLDLSRVESGKFSVDYSRFNILRLIEEAMTMFSEEILAKNLSFKFDHVDECPEYIYLDKDRLRQILTNIIGNAVKFTEDGLIEVKLTLEVVGPKEADVIIEVKDTGIGIPEKNLDTIFGEFEQVDNVHLHYGGTGLGLAISKRLVEMMNGKLTVKSKEGRGSDFKIKLNKVGIVDQEDETNDLKKQQYFFEPAKIILVDECQLTRDLFEAYLSVTRLTIKTYESGFEALKEIDTFNPDLIITEINMKSMDGFQLAEEVRALEKFQNTPLIAITSITHTGSRQKFRVFNAFLKKPISVNEFYHSISHFLPCQKITKNLDVKEVHVEGHEADSSPSSFVKYVNKEIRDKCAEILQYQVINDYQNLYRILKCIEEEKDLKDLKTWLEDFQKNLDVFNFDALNRQIEYLMNSKDSTVS